MKLKSLLLPLLLVGGAAAPATALTLEVVHSTPVDLSTAGQLTHQDTFDLTTQGYNPASQQVVSAYASFDFSDQRGSNPETVQVDLGSGVIFGTASNFLTVVIDGNVVGSLLLSLSDTGLLDYTIRNTSGMPEGSAPARDFRFVGATLTATVADRQPASVPDHASTALLLGGAALLGTSAYQRRRR